ATATWTAYASAPTREPPASREGPEIALQIEEQLRLRDLFAVAVEDLPREARHRASEGRQTERLFPGESIAAPVVGGEREIVGELARAEADRAFERTVRAEAFGDELAVDLDAAGLDEVA